MSQQFKRISALCLVAFSLQGAVTESVCASPVSQQKTDVKGKNTSTDKKTAVKKTAATQKKGAVGSGASAASSRRRRAVTAVKQETSADVKKREAATQKEIRQTEQQIKENEKSVRQGLSELGKLEGEISNSKKKIAETTGKINALAGKIGSLEGGISKNESELNKLRDEYLKAVKKMRVAQKNRSGLAFVFASENFHQALRRMRYLKQFSAWKDRQSDAINEKTSQLKTQRDQLAAAKVEQDRELKLQKSEQSVLQQQYGKQDAIVAELKANGKALQTHLSKKQAEANELRNRISALIAEEERRAAEERARQEAARRAEEERLAREERARQEAEEAKSKAEAEARAEAQAKEKEENARLLAQKEKEARAGDKKAKAEAERLRKEQEKKDREAKKEEENRRKELANKKAKEKAAAEKAEKEASSKNYADARKRAPRSSGGAASTSGSSAAAKSSASAAGNFAAMKGNLPKPVSGSFKVTSKFGRQSLPDLPDVVYDNPGIDAEVGSGASALAVYGGKVSGVYMIPGYNTVVIVNHGNYYTVYGNIASPSVKVGDAVNVGQRLGSLAPDEDDRSRSLIHFEVWRNREKLNPLEWLR